VVGYRSSVFGWKTVLTTETRREDRKSGLRVSDQFEIFLRSFWTKRAKQDSMPRMETLNLSDPAPRTDGRLKSLFWPSIQSGADVDYLGTQGFWVCAVVAAISTALLFVTGHPIGAVATFIFFYVGGMGVRERSWIAALLVFLVYATETVLAPGIVRLLLSALLFSNLRGTWIASHWKPDSEAAATFPPRFNDTLGDKLADQWPMWLWPKLRILYFMFAPVYALLEIVGAVMIRAGKLR
jgi:hypothetical protein